MIKSFLSGRFLKIIVDSQVSEAYGINSGAQLGSRIGSTLFLLYINDLPKNILRSLVNIYVDDTTICVHLKSR